MLTANNFCEKFRVRVFETLVFIYAEQILSKLEGTFLHERQFY